MLKQKYRILRQLPNILAKSLWSLQLKVKKNILLDKKILNSELRSNNSQLGTHFYKNWPIFM